MNANALKFLTWPIIVLIITVVSMNKSETSQLQNDMESIGESRPITDINRNPDIMNTKWGYCYEPNAKIIQMKDSEYRAYHCNHEL